MSRLFSFCTHVRAQILATHQNAQTRTHALIHTHSSTHPCTHPSMHFISGPRILPRQRHLLPPLILQSHHPHPEQTGTLIHMHTSSQISTFLLYSRRHSHPHPRHPHTYLDMCTLLIRLSVFSPQSGDELKGAINTCIGRLSLGDDRG